MPRIFVIGGPNGAGKTTAATGSLPEILACDEYVNADAIARALSPFAVDRTAFKAGRLMIERINELADSNRDFAFETTMASRSFAPFLRSCRDRGYEVHLIFLWLTSVRLAQDRVARRVRKGGHGIPGPTIKRRYRAGIRNFFKLYVPLAHRWVLYDNSGPEPGLVARSAGPDAPELIQPETWNKVIASSE